MDSPDFLKELFAHRRLVRITGSAREIRSAEDLNTSDGTQPKNTIVEIRLSRSGRQLMKKRKA